MRTMHTICFVLALAACKRTEPAAPPPPVTTTPTTTSAPGSQNLAPLAGIAVRMHDEATQRPHVKVTAEALFDALASRGVEFASKKQVLAATAQASYCALGVTAESIAIAVCEYATADAARAGKQLLDTRYAKLVPDAVRSLNGNTLVTVANGTGHPARRDQVLETFSSL
jgi:hypothetical protein